MANFSTHFGTEKKKKEKKGGKGGERGEKGGRGGGEGRGRIGGGYQECGVES